MFDRETRIDKAIKKRDKNEYDRLTKKGYVVLKAYMQKSII